MDIIVSSPGSPGTSFTDNVKEQIITFYDVLCEHDNFDSAGGLRKYLEEKYGYRQAYTRNILAFLQNCGIVNYQNIDVFENKNFFTNIGKTYVDILKCIKIVNGQDEIDDIIFEKLNAIENIIYFQCLVLMMKNKDCSYAQDFFDVLRFVDCFGSINSTEYLLIQYEREHCEGNYIVAMDDIVNKYRNKEIEINVLTKTKNDDKGTAKSVNSFPYVNGNFSKSGVFVKDDSGRFIFNTSRYSEIQSAIKEVSEVWLNSVQ